MSDPYEGAKVGRLTFKGGSLATRKSIDKKKKKKKKKMKMKHKKHDNEDDESQPSTTVNDTENADKEAGKIYSIDAAKNMKYGELFSVEAKKFGYDPKTTFTNVEQALDGRVKKKADRYCK